MRLWPWRRPLLLQGQAQGSAWLELGEEQTWLELVRVQTSPELGWTALELGRTLLGLVKEWAWLGVMQERAMLRVALAPSLGVNSTAGVVVSAAGAAATLALQCSWVVALA